MSGGSFVVLYDTSVFAQLQPADVSLGVLPDDPTYSTANGWTVTYAPPSVGQPQGYAFIEIQAPGSGNVTTTGGGSLVVMNFHVLANAPIGTSHIDLAADTDSGGTPQTSLSDGFDGPVGGGLLYNLQPNPLDNTGDLQTITFGGAINAGGTFTLGFGGQTTGAINYSANPATLQANIQTALNNLPSIGTDTNTGVTNSLVVAQSSTTVSVTFQGLLGGGVTQPVLSWTSNLTGTNASVAVTDSGFGYYGLPSNDNLLMDPTDGAVAVIGTNTAPTANNDIYAITARDVATDPGLGVASPGILVNDTSPIGNPLSASLVTGPAHGTVVVNGDQTINFSGVVNGDTFQLLFANFTTAPITYSSTPATLQANIQSAPRALMTSTPITGLGTPVVTANSADQRHRDVPIGDQRHRASHFGVYRYSCRFPDFDDYRRQPRLVCLHARHGFPRRRQLHLPGHRPRFRWRLGQQYRHRESHRHPAVEHPDQQCRHAGPTDRRAGQHR